MRPNAPSGSGSASMPVDGRDARQAKPPQVRHAQRNAPRDVAERVAAVVAIVARVRQLAAADAVEHDQDDAVRD